MESIRGKITRRLPDSQGLRRFVLVAEKSADVETSEALFDCVVTAIYQGEIPEPGTTVTIVGTRLAPFQFSVQQMSVG